MGSLLDTTSVLLVSTEVDERLLLDQDDWHGHGAILRVAKKNAIARLMEDG